MSLISKKKSYLNKNLHKIYDVNRKNITFIIKTYIRSRDRSIDLTED